MTTSGTRSWTLTVDDVVREATERLGGEPVLGNELVSARRSLNLLITNLINAGVLTFTLNNIFVTCSVSQVSYDLPTSTVDVLNLVVRNSAGTDLEATRITFADYLRIPNKTQSGRPVQFMVDRRVDNPVVYLWLVPDQAYVLNILAERRIEDITAGNQDIGLPWRFMDVLASGLAYYLSLKRIGIPGDRMLAIKQQFDDALRVARREDRDRAPFQVSPRLRGI